MLFVFAFVLLFMFVLVLVMVCVGVLSLPILESYSVLDAKAMVCRYWRRRDGAKGFVSVIFSVAPCGMYEVNDGRSIYDYDVTIRKDKTRDSRAPTDAMDDT